MAFEVLVPRYGHSEPGRLFRTADFPPTPLDELETIARELRAALGGDTGFDVEPLRPAPR
jgi:hypothetical protein